MHGGILEKASVLVRRVMWSWTNGLRRTLARFPMSSLALLPQTSTKTKSLAKEDSKASTGVLPDTNEVVAVKIISQRSKQGRKEYVSEVTIISKLRHYNLMQLLGWCHKKGKFLLVYEFLPNESLDKHLFGEKKLTTTHLQWDQRYNIACDVASALVYLHKDCEQRVVDRDIKANNVMLDLNFIGKLGDFGLDRVVEWDQRASHTTLVVGTYGYLVPECVIIGKASTESDVYSFRAV